MFAVFAIKSSRAERDERATVAFPGQRPLVAVRWTGNHETTIYAGGPNAERTLNTTLFLTLLGGNAFGNDLARILGALRRFLQLYRSHRLDVAIVSHGQ